MKDFTTIKKLGIGTGVVGVFVAYSLVLRHESLITKKSTSISQNSSTGNSVATSPKTNNTNTDTTSAKTKSVTPQSLYKDGIYDGAIADAFYGNVEVEATVNNGKITDITFVQYPNSHGTSVMINQQAMPSLKQEAIQAQSANVQVISGATFTSQAFIQSLSAALSKAMV